MGFRSVTLAALILMAVQHLPRVGAAGTCGGREVTIAGTEDGDRLAGTEGPDVIAGLGGNDRIEGMGGYDVICDGAGRDIVGGGPGRDIVVVGDGYDVLAGGRGRDTLSFVDQVPYVTVELYRGESWTEGGATDRIRDFRHVIGSDGGDEITGDRTDNVIVGRGGADVLNGLRGRDRLYGKGGSDLHDGGGKWDVCEYRADDRPSRRCERRP